MDKGSDSEKIHVLVREEIKAESIIPVRVRKSKRTKRKYRKQKENTENKRKIQKTTTFKL